MVGFFLLNCTFSRSSLIKKPLNPLCLCYNSIKRYNNQSSKLGHKEIEKERARSTAEQFKTVADEKLRDDKQGPETRASDEPNSVKRSHIDRDPDPNLEKK